MIYFAPLQGYTDWAYRLAYSNIFKGIDAFFIPYISVKYDTILKKHHAEILPENNPENRVIPQILAKDENEIIFLSKILKDHGYEEINLNLGCPYPMVTNRGKGAGLLPNPMNIKKILDAFFESSNQKLSVKLRAGLKDETEIKAVLPVLNSYPLTEIIFHPRIAKQLYKGKIIESAHSFCENNTNHKLIYNGDIFTLSDFWDKQSKFNKTHGWMLGRGILMNPFLPSEIQGISFSKEKKRNKLIEFHQLIYENYQEKLDNEGNVLNKMKQFWIYFSFNFENSKKAFKQIKKSNSLNRYLAETHSLFNNFM